jgi:hypothetical protein
MIKPGCEDAQSENENSKLSRINEEKKERELQMREKRSKMKMLEAKI